MRNTFIERSWSRNQGFRCGTTAAESMRHLRGADGRSGARLSGRRVLGHDLEGATQLIGRAELHDLGPGVEHRRVPGACVVCVARLEHLFTVRGPECDLATDHIAEVLALT